MEKSCIGQKSVSESESESGNGNKPIDIVVVEYNHKCLLMTFNTISDMTCIVCKNKPTTLTTGKQTINDTEQPK